MAKVKPSEADYLLAQVLSGLNLPVFIVDPKNLHIVMANSAAEDLTGRTVADLAGTELKGHFAANSVRKVLDLCEICADTTQGMEEQDCQLVRRSGRKTHVNLRANVITFRQQPRLLLAMQDLTPILKMEREREKQLREMTQVAKLADIGMLTAGVAHELNNPLMIVQGFAENLDLLLDQPVINREEVKGQAREILLAVERMSRIISQMTRLVRSVDVKWEVAELRNVVESVTRFIAHEFRHHQIDLKVDIGASLLIKCDANQIEQVILNILSNAIHALIDRHEPRQIVIKSSTSMEAIDLSIWNNGPPIPRPVQDKIMTPFFTTKEVGKGTGLGLSVSYGIMKAHGGGLTLSRSTTEGTEFKLTFPVVTKDQETLILQESKKVLLITQDADIVSAMTERVQTFGLKILRARTAVEGEMMLHQHKSIIGIFTERTLPDMTIESFCKNVSLARKPPPVMVVLSKSALTRQEENQLLAHGFSAVLKTPINHNSFSAVMEKMKVGTGTAAA